MFRFALPLLALAFLGQASKLKTPENQWVKPGDSTVLKCEAMTEVTSCSWSTSYGEVYLMGSGNTAENGRLRYLLRSDSFTLLTRFLLMFQF